MSGLNKINGDSRTANVVRNVLWGTGGTILIAIAGFVVRTVFVYVLGAEYLGINGLFSNVLAVLSFSDLGLGSAITYALYKPIAEGDEEKIKALMQLFKKAYRIIALVVLAFGLVLMPFLDVLVNSTIPMEEIRVYYAFFLFNTVISYLVIYKTTYITALQKNYIVSNANNLGTIAIYVAQIAVILLTNSFLAYLLAHSVVLLAKNICISLYADKRFPLLKEKTSQKVDEPTKKKLFKDVRALIIHKFGDISVHQSDNIIVSAFLSTKTVGLISNYTIITSMLSSFTGVVFGSFTASLGNLIAQEGPDRRTEIFDEFDFLCFWINAFVFVGCVALSQPFIAVWLGDGLQIDDLTMFLMFLAVFLEGQTTSVYHFKIADGRFAEDQWLAFIQAIINLVVSIALVQVVGLPGVYVGTIVQRFAVVVWRPHIVYKYILQRSARRYYLRFALRTLLAMVLAIGMKYLVDLAMMEVTIPWLLLGFAMVAVIPNAVIALLHFRTREFKSLIGRLKGGLGRKA